MYNLYNLNSSQFESNGSMRSRGWTSNPMQFETKAELLDFWARNIGSDFSDLNVTGKDISVHTYYIKNYIEKVSEIKPYLVTDENGRHVDVRLWDMELRIIPRKFSFWKRYASMGSKDHSHRTNGPSMRRQSLLLRKSEIEELGNGEQITVPGIRSKVLINVIDEINYYDRAKNHSKSWKDQGKAERQYVRHKKRGSCTVPKTADDDVWGRLAADGFPVCETVWG